MMRAAIGPDGPPQLRSRSGGQKTDGACDGTRTAVGKCITVGLINNMPDGAIESTERQFLTVLNAAAGEMSVDLRLYSLPELPRSQAARRQMSARYCGLDELWASRLDGLIVTGTEPRAERLMQEPYWKSFTRVLDWAQAHTISTVWSCLAAHAAVLYMDGVARAPLADKRFGVFEFSTVSAHPLLQKVPPRIRVAHSRWNELPEKALRACNYSILTLSPEAGVDAFIKQRDSLFVFFQGHPEYDRRALLLEYRRDVGRFLRGERERYPAIPHGYFKPAAVDAVTRFRQRAMIDRHETLLESFPLAFLENRLASSARSSPTRIYGNWLAYLSDRKELASRGHTEPASLQAQMVEGVG